jgi:S-(hydroxymethyl)glutathione dehydrogenase/alcohol dehydrogenase
MKALVVNALGGEFDLEDVDVAAPCGREVLVEVHASGLCHTDLLFATHDIVPLPATVEGVNYGSSNFKHDIPMYAELYLQGRMNLDDLVSKKIALRDVNDGYSALKDGSFNRVVVTSFE